MVIDITFCNYGQPRLKQGATSTTVLQAMYEILLVSKRLEGSALK
jgi:hypothetical protein